MKMLIIFFMLLIPVTIVPQTDEQINEVQTQLVNLMRMEFKAFQIKDESAWSSLVDDEAIFTGVEEGFKTKQDIVSEMKNAPEFYRTASENYSGIIVKLFDDVAVLSCTSTLALKDKEGQPVSIPFRFTRIHKLENGKWKLIYHNGLPI